MSTTENRNFLSPTSFHFTMERLQNTTYFCQEVDLPGVTLQEARQSNPMVQIWQPGSRMDFEPLTLQFMVDEDLKNYLEIFDWMSALGHPDNTAQYNMVKDKVSDGTLTILTSHNNPNIEINYRNMFPTNLTPLRFTVKDQSIEYLEATVTFRYEQFFVKKL